MCGIYGWLGGAETPTPSLFEKQSMLLQHRGPDDSGYQQGDGWGFGFRRLSILDLSPQGHQPMAMANGRYWLIFNGEIYNYVELRAELARQGEHFVSHTDSEVLLKLLARDGARALTALNGMFALAFVDTQARTFLLARDRLGKKPLYYSLRGGQLRFGSELKALLAWPDASRNLNLAAVAEYMAHGYLPNEICIFQGYQKLAPGSFLSGALDDPANSQPKRYWQVQLNGETDGAAFGEQALEELQALLTDAVRIRLRSDVPVGVFLSGGLDSGLVTALIAQTGTEVKPVALTVGFAEAAYDETSLARAVAEQSGLEHRIVQQHPNSLAEVDTIGWYCDEPFGDASALPTMALCAAGAQHATVFLSGDGGDEAFGGYRRYIEAKRLGWVGQLPPFASQSLGLLAKLLPVASKLRYQLAKSSLPDAGYAAAFDGIVNDPMLPHLLSPVLQLPLKAAGQALATRWAASRGQPLTARQQLLDYNLYLPDDILVKMDRASMAHSIEVRSPLLDHRLVEWAARLPRSVLLNSSFGKLPLRQLGKKLLPATVQSGEKRGFGVPLADWFQQPAGQAFLRERLLSPEAKQRGLWNIEQVAALIARPITKQARSFEEYLWRLLVLDSWARFYLDGPRFLQGPPATGLRARTPIRPIAHRAVNGASFERSLIV